MKYSTMVKKNAKVLDAKGLKKAAVDLAAILDNEVFIVNPKLRGHEFSESASIREGVFNAFCKVCVEAGIALPTLEPALYEAFLPEKASEEDQKKAATFVNAIKFQSLNESEDAIILLAIAEVVALFPKAFASDYSGINGKTITAKANSLLVGLGLDPIRPDYASLRGKLPLNQAGPAKEVLVLVVDDEAKSIARSLKNLAGWKNLRFDFCHIKRKDWNDNTSREDRLKAMVEKILAFNTDIILMDQGIDQDIEGSDLTCEIRKMKGNDSPIIVPNTGGSPEKLQEAGATSVNFEKGDKLEAIVTAIRYL